MKCAKCPLFTSWNNESDRGESCGLFGDSWDNVLQYEDKKGTIQGCYVDKHFIEKMDRKFVEHLEHDAAAYMEWISSPPTEEVTDDA